MRCEQCQPQLLHFVYDLLEPEERAMAAAHVERCPACQEALKSVREQVGLLAEAVKEPAADVVFKAPASASPASSAATVAPTVAMTAPPRRRRPIFLVNRWSLAAGILLAIFSVGGVVGWNVYHDNLDRWQRADSQLVQASQNLAKAQKELDERKGQTQKEIRAIHQQIDKLFSDWRDQETIKRKVLEKERVQAIVNGPQVAQAGAPNSYQVQVYKGQDQRTSNFMQAPGMKQQQQSGLPNQALNVRVVDQRNKTLYNQDLVTQKDGTANFVLPSDIPFKPGDDVRLIFETRSPEGKLIQLGDSLKLVFPEYITHLATDRPMYRPGDTVRFRSLTLERFSLKPARETFHLRYRIVGPMGKEEFKQDVASQLKGDKGQDLTPVHGIGVGDFALPTNLPGGQYTLFVSEVNDRFREEKRTFLVHQWQAPRLNKEVQFHRSSYGAGDLVRVQLKVTPVQGALAGMRSNIQVQAKAVVDGADINATDEQQGVTNEDGTIAFTLTLPGQIHKGVGSVAFTCNDGGNVETIRRTIPIVVNNLTLEFYPEGGDLIAGAVNRVYFQALTPAGKPADIEATLYDERRQKIATLKTLRDDKEPGINQGLGQFSFTPQPGRRYHVRLDAPIGIDRAYPLPVVKNQGLVMSIPSGVADDVIDVTLQSPKQARELLVGAYCRGRMLDHQFVRIAANQPAQVALRPQVNVGGVYRITVFEKLKVKDGLVYRPLAERLIYRKHPARLDVSCQPARASYQPGEKVELKLRALNEKREAASAWAMVAVVDQSLLKLADEKTARTMPTHFLLTTEVNHPDDLENADVLLGPHPKAAQALDLLLGCQGWRRFAEQDPQRFQQRIQQPQLPVFVMNSALPVPQTLDAEQKQIDKLDEGYSPRAIELQKALAAREKQESELPDLGKKADLAQASLQNAEQARQDADHRLREIQTVFVQFGLGGALLMLLFVGFFLVSVGLRRLAEGEPARPWLLAGLSLLGLLFVVSVIGTFLFMGEHMMDNLRGRGGPGFGFAANKKMMAPMMAPAPGFAPMMPMPPEAALRDEELESDGDGKKAEPIMPAGAPIQVANDNPAGNVFNQDGNLLQNQARQNVEQWFNQDERDLRQQGKYQAILQRQLGRRVQLPPANDPCIVREYAHQRQPRKDGTRRDFAPTLYWHPVLTLPDGQATVSFDLSDAVTRFDVLVFSHSADGRLGANRFEIASRLPFSIEPKTPIEVANSDRITVPVAICNETPAKIGATLSLRTRGLTLEGLPERGVELKANEKRRELFQVKPSIVEGEAAVRFIARQKAGGDAVERRFHVVPDGFPIAKSAAGLLENAPIEHTITLPEQWLPGTLRVEAILYPSPVAELQSGLDALLREPAGCFEQTSSSNYPNVMILNYMKSAGLFNVNFRASPLLEKRARALLQSGYQQLTSFECVDPQKASQRRGYEWFGGAAPPHEALTAYGLMQFRDMARIYPVDEAMLRRTEQYLLDQRDKKGGFQRNPKGLDRFGNAPDPVTNAYIVWALTESGTKEKLDVELTALRGACKGTKDPYLLALTALAHLNAGKTLQGVQMLRDLREFQKADGELTGAVASITGSQGRDLVVETTALAALGWVRAAQAPDFNVNLNRAVQWLGQQRRGAGGFGATQATILALKALLAHAERHPRLNQGGEITLTLRDTRVPVAPPLMMAPGVKMAPPAMMNGLPEANRAFYSPHSQEPIKLSLRDVSGLAPGKNVIELRPSAPGSLPYVLTWSYRTRQPANDPAAPVKLASSLSKDLAQEGETVKLTAQVENVSGKGQGMTVAILGLPAGLAVPDDFEQLKAASASGKIAAWELRGRDLVLYWRDLAPKAKIDMDLDLICRLPGAYTGPASRAYLYYDADGKFWSAPLSIRIDPTP